MGASISTNSVNSMISNSIDVLNTYAQTCAVSGTGAQNQIILNGCTLKDGSKIDILNQQVVSQSCITNANTQVAISSSVSQTMRQAAQAITQQFSFPSIASANNFIQDSITLGDFISNTYNSNCSTNISQGKNEIVCNDSTIDNSIIQIEDFQSVTQQCILNAISNSSIYNTVVNDLRQTSVAKQQDTFAAILGVIALFLAIGAWFVISIARTDAAKWLVVFLVLFFVLSSVIYTATAKERGNYPYTKA
ncbi:MAG TPA: hypothetical protein VLG50_07845 [Candidatus Saccharimonadales bacterium]|nr:hypothetical protein [Candidatus Saccharimonadales bacterium]